MASRNTSSPPAKSSFGTSAFENTPSPPAESSSGRNHPPYDVFISHYGEDTKHTVASSIYKKLDATGLRVFLDKNELKYGDFFPQILEEAIAKASLHIAIFSVNCAKSHWSLDELKLILLQTTNAIFIPIFYHIEPSSIRWVTEGIYADALCQHEKNNRYSPETFECWKSVLHKASFYIGQIINNQC